MIIFFTFLMASTIEPYQPTYKPGVEACVVDAFMDAFNKIPRTQEERDNRERVVRKMVGYDTKAFEDDPTNRIHHVATEDERVIGYVSSKPDLEKGQIYFYQIAVHSDYKNQGIGRSLIQSVLNSFRSRLKELDGLQQNQLVKKEAIAWLYVLRTNPSAMEFYKALGFTECDESTRKSDPSVYDNKPYDKEKYTIFEKYI